MSEPVACPTCQTLLRLPPGAPAVRCPNCKTVLTVSTAPVPVSPPPPPPPVAPAVAPLPFGRAPAARPAPPPTAAPAPPRGTGATRARLVPENPYDAPAIEEENVEAAEAERERRIREELAVLEEQERKDEAKFKELSGQLKKARLGMQLFAIGSIGSSLTAVIAAFFIVTSLVALPFLPLVFFAFFLLVSHWLLTIGGFAYCLGGPPPMRGIAIGGIVVTIAHAMMCVLAGIVTSAGIAQDLLSGAGLDFGIAVVNNLLVSNMVCNLTVLTDLPIYLTMSTVEVRKPVLVLLVVAAACEFAKLSILGIITNRYAVAGKDPDLGYLGMRFVYRIFALVLVGPILKGMIFGLLSVGLMSIPLMLATVGYFLWWAFSWFHQYQVMMDTADVMTPDRYVDKRDRLDYV